MLLGFTHLEHILQKVRWPFLKSDCTFLSDFCYRRDDGDFKVPNTFLNLALALFMSRGSKQARSLLLSCECTLSMKNRAAPSSRFWCQLCGRSSSRTTLRSNALIIWMFQCCVIDEVTHCCALSAASCNCSKVESDSCESAYSCLYGYELWQFYQSRKDKSLLLK